jgi:D-cysteine desulfhydrase family pyridoxal phosphate-dependent enzyme
MNDLPRLHFAHLPTPVEALPALTRLLDGPTLLVKRDDQTGLAFGGNKTRKLEFLVADALARGADLLITGGAAQSNHCRQTAAAAAKFGLDCTLVLAGDPPDHASANLILDQLLGADLVWTTNNTRDATMARMEEEARSAGRTPCLIPYGGSNEIGALGYVFAMEELLKQGHQPDWIVVASSSGGTQAGLTVGARLFGYQGRILGISIDKPEVELSRDIVADLATRTARHLGEDIRFSASDILANDRYLGGGYGVMGELEIEAIHLFARTEALLLDPVYTGRAAAGLLDRIRDGFFKREDTVLFWHTGGTPVLFADKYAGELC